MKLLPLFSAVVLMLTAAGPAAAEWSKEDHYRLGEMASVCGLYHQDVLPISTVRHWAELTRKHDKVLRIIDLIKSMREAMKDPSVGSKSFRRDFTYCYNTIITVLNDQI